MTTDMIVGGCVLLATAFVISTAMVILWLLTRKDSPHAPIKCKECKYFQKGNAEKIDQCRLWTDLGGPVRPCVESSFCGYGERS